MTQTAIQTLLDALRNSTQEVVDTGTLEEVASRGIELSRFMEELAELKELCSERLRGGARRLAAASDKKTIKITADIGVASVTFPKDKVIVNEVAVFADIKPLLKERYKEIFEEDRKVTVGLREDYLTVMQTLTPALRAEVESVLSTKPATPTVTYR